VEITRILVEHIHPIRRFIKLKTPFSIIKNALNDIRFMHDFNYQILAETTEKFWEEECEIHPTSSTCKLYDD